MLRKNNEIILRYSKNSSEGVFVTFGLVRLEVGRPGPFQHCPVFQLLLQSDHGGTGLKAAKK